MLRKLVEKISRARMPATVDGRDASRSGHVSQPAPVGDGNGPTHGEMAYAGHGSEAVAKSIRLFHRKAKRSAKRAAQGESHAAVKQGVALTRTRQAKVSAEKTTEAIEKRQEDVHVSPAARRLKWFILGVLWIGDSIGLAAALVYAGDPPWFGLVLTAGFGASVVGIGVAIGYIVLYMQRRFASSHAVADETADDGAASAEATTEHEGTAPGSDRWTQLLLYGMLVAICLGAVAGFTTILLRIGTPIPSTVAAGLGLMTFLSSIVCTITTIGFYDEAADYLDAQRAAQHKFERAAARPLLNIFVRRYERHRTAVDNLAGEYTAEGIAGVSQSSVQMNVMLMNSSSIIGIRNTSAARNATPDGGGDERLAESTDEKPRVNLYPHEPSLNPPAPGYDLEDLADAACGTNRKLRRPLLEEATRPDVSEDKDAQAAERSRAEQAGRTLQLIEELIANLDDGGGEVLPPAPTTNGHGRP